MPRLIEARALNYAGVGFEDLRLAHSKLIASIGYECYRALLNANVMDRLVGMNRRKIREVSASPNLMDAVIEAIVRGGYAQISGGRLAKPAESIPPRDIPLWVNRISRAFRAMFSVLPDLLISGRSGETRREDLYLALMALYDNPAARFESAVALLGIGLTDETLLRKWGDVGLIPATLLVPWSELGLLAVDALRLTGMRVVVAAPPGSGRLVRLVVATQGPVEEKRLKVLESDPLEFGLKLRKEGVIEGQADAALLVNVFQWLRDPVTFLEFLRWALSEEAPIFILQGIWEEDARIMGLVYPLIGARLPPTLRELESTLARAGLKFRELARARGVVLLRAARREVRA
ncbi:MAG TPA: hypothetical protein ENG69_05970 [Candidatus Korarchaeota archaeon]|nr:hypothetical protein [Candidatus Korarchaeota archaeon]